jgi:hypothetical protein
VYPENDGHTHIFKVNYICLDETQVSLVCTWGQCKHQEFVKNQWPA